MAEQIRAHKAARLQDPRRRSQTAATGPDLCELASVSGANHHRGGVGRPSRDRHSQGTDLVAGYPEVSILNGCDVVVNEGDFVGIIGPNGAGKSRRS